jgi:RNA polymerase sigma-70 factor, ECF subfamily
MSVSKLQQQEQGAFSDLHSKYRERLLSRMKGIVRDQQEAEDITSAAFQKAFENFESFRGESSFYTWVNSIAFNNARAMWQKRRSEKMEPIETLEFSLADSDRPDLAFEDSEPTRQLRKAMMKIPAVYRRVLAKHFLDGTSTKLIAEQERIPRGTVLSRIYVGKQQ